jgi:hypothetical protein
MQGCKTQGIWVLTTDPRDLDPDIGSMRNLGMRSCYTQATWVKRSFPTPSFLSLEGDPLPKLMMMMMMMMMMIYFAL